MPRLTKAERAFKALGVYERRHTNCQYFFRNFRAQFNAPYGSIDKYSVYGMSVLTDLPKPDGKLTAYRSANICLVRNDDPPVRLPSLEELASGFVAATDINPLSNFSPSDFLTAAYTFS